MDTPQPKFEGWAVVEIMGHNREIGFVTTEYYGAAALFRVDTPSLPEREYTLKRPELAHETESHRVWAPAGSKVKRQAIPAKSALVGPSSIFRITPCTEETALRAIEDLIERPLILLELAKTSERPALISAGSRHCEECGLTPEEGHLDDCSFAEDDTAISSLDDDEGETGASSSPAHAGLAPGVAATES